jgi:hypothetical protein
LEDVDLFEACMDDDDDDGLDDVAAGPSFEPRRTRAKSRAKAWHKLATLRRLGRGQARRVRVADTPPPEEQTPAGPRCPEELDMAEVLMMRDWL